jgi:Flp pilus assembly protein TadB
VVGGVTALSLGAGVCCGLGVVLVILGFRGTPHHERHHSPNRDSDLRRVGIAVGAGVVVAAITRWPVGGVLAGAMVFAWRPLFGQRAVSASDIARIEAVASWAEMLRDTMAAAAGLEQAIVVTAPVGPPPIRPELLLMAGRLEAREVSLAGALAEFADRIADPTADLVVSALVLAAERRARSLGPLLGALAASAREEAAMRMRVEAGRARTRTSARIVSLFTVLLAGGLVLLKRDFLSPYNDAAGQIVLMVVGAIFAAGFVWLTKMAEISAPQRLLTRWGRVTEAQS